MPQSSRRAQYLRGAEIEQFNEQGSALMLAPAGVLILLLLGGLAVDSAIAFGAQRELESRVTGAINDAATLSLTPEQLQRGSDAQMSPNSVTAIVRSRVATSAGAPGLQVDPNDIDVVTDVEKATVTVTATGHAPFIFAKAIPGRGDRATVRTKLAAELLYRPAN